MLYRRLQRDGRKLLASKDVSGGVMGIVSRLQQATAHPDLVWRAYGMSDRLPEGVYSTKITELLHLMQSQPKGSKSLIFYHWTYEGEAIKHAVETELLQQCVFLRGKMSDVARASAVEEFTSGQANAMVIQIDAGNQGINLQAATHIYIASLAWNASTEMQAIGRAHRINVGHEVKVVRLAIQDTIDEHILAAQTRKLLDAADVLEDDRIADKLQFSLHGSEIKTLFDADNDDDDDDDDDNEAERKREDDSVSNLAAIEEDQENSFCTQECDELHDFSVNLFDF
jgi:superfamily II DNA or RNA helicase